MKRKLVLVIICLFCFISAYSAPASAAIFETKDGALIYYEDQGQGKPLVMIHGWSCSSKVFKNNVPELAKDFRVITIDLRGHGKSSKILHGHTIPQYAQDVRAVIEHLKL